MLLLCEEFAKFISMPADCISKFITVPAFASFMDVVSFRPAHPEHGNEVHEILPDAVQLQYRPWALEELAVHKMMCSIFV